jgi:hypothetical protein
MGEKTDRTLRALKARMNGKTPWAIGVGSVTVVLGFLLQQGWIAIAWETTAHAATTYETREHAAEVYETKAEVSELRSESERARLVMQAQLDTMEEDHREHMRMMRVLEHNLVRLLVRLGVQPVNTEEEP